MVRRKRTVVYVEDDPAVQRLVTYWLEDAGFRVLVAGDGQAGLELVQSERPDLVVTDALMPGMSGDELVQALGEDTELREIPIIMATAAASPLRVKKMLSLGCYAVLTKPLDETSFLAAVDEALSG